MIYERNVLTKFTLTVAKEDVALSERLLVSLLTVVDNVSSYIIYSVYRSNELKSWRIECYVSQTERFNCIPKDEAIKEIVCSINTSLTANKPKTVIGWRQPPLEVLIEILEPLVNKLAIEQSQAWKIFEFDDLKQVCRMAICNLYNGGYYVHKNLVRRTFLNTILMKLRKERRKPLMVALDDAVGHDEQGNEITYLDVIADDNSYMEMFSMESAESKENLLAQQRALVIERIGQRQYDQLIREYSNKMTTNAGRTKLNRLKSYFLSISINEKSFNHLK